MSWKYNYGNELFHYGILGMRWGRRKSRSADHQLHSKLKRKHVSQMSNDEIRTYNNRANLERNYKSFKPNYLKSGIAIVGTTAAVLGSYKAIKSGAPTVINDGKAIVNKLRHLK